MKFWMDIVNSPHVLFFKPLIEELNSRGHSVSITAREYAQTTGLLDKFQLPYTLIGAHAGTKITRKVIDVYKRGTKLRAYAKDKDFAMALTFNSPSLALAAKILRIPSMVFMDYEHQPLNHLTFRLCDKVVTPACFPDEFLIKYGAIHKTFKFDGLKEQLYLSDFQPDQDFLNSLNIDKNKIIVVARPPATMALYHRFENDLFYDVIKYILKNKEVIMIVMPRSENQRFSLMSINESNLIIPEEVLDGRDLMCCSDIVISAGGTMNREAAILGIPAYTVFKGNMGAVDKYLIDLGRIVPIENLNDVKKIYIQKNLKKDTLINTNLTTNLVDLILNS